MDRLIDYAKIAVISYIATLAINRALDSFGLSQFKA